MHKYFEKVIFALIGLSSMKLVYDTYILELDEESIEVRVSNGLDNFFT